MAIGNHTLPTDMMNTCTDGFVYCFAKWASDVTTGFFWTFMLLAFAIVSFIATSRYGGVRAFAFASFIGMIGGVWLSVLTLISWKIGSTFIIVGVVGLMAMIISEK